MDNHQSFYFKPWHFILSILLFTILAGIIAGKKINSIPSLEKENSVLTELHEINLDKEGTTFLYFYRRDSELCQKMRYNIEQLDMENLHGIQFYAMDVETHDEYYYKYNVSGIPNILIFNGNSEAQRVMGIVSTNNLEKIVKRIKSL